MAKHLQINRNQSEGSFPLKPLTCSVSLFPKNSDASFINENLLAGGAWLCRDEQGALVHAEGREFLAASALVAEAFVLPLNIIRDAISYAITAGWTRVWVESDSKLLILSILEFPTESPASVSRPFHIILSESLLGQFVSIHLEFIRSKCIC